MDVSGILLKSQTLSGFQELFYECLFPIIRLGQREFCWIRHVSNNNKNGVLLGIFLSSFFAFFLSFIIPLSSFSPFEIAGLVLAMSCCVAQAGLKLMGLKCSSCLNLPTSGSVGRHHPVRLLGIVIASELRNVSMFGGSWVSIQGDTQPGLEL